VTADCQSFVELERNEMRGSGSEIFDLMIPSDRSLSSNLNDRDRIELPK
jgi:hypothetical protein